MTTDFPFPPLNTVILNGSLHQPSRTQVLLDALHVRLAQHLALDATRVEVSQLLPALGTALSVDALAPAARAAVAAIEAADFLIVGCPVFRGSYPGLFKHLLDLVDLQALAGKPVLLAATGGSQRHALVIDHQLRPLFGFFQALTLPIGVYATPEDIQDGAIASAALHERIDLAVSLAQAVLTQRQATTAPSPYELLET